MLSPGPGHLAGGFRGVWETFYFIFCHSGFVFEEIFQVKETDRIERTARGGSDIVWMILIS